MGQLIAFVFKAALTVVLLVFVLGFGAMGLCAMGGLGSQEALFALLLMAIAGGAIWGLVRMVIGMWKPNDDDRDAPPDDA